mmetsp:Transcript_122250/g.191762  ORF Transcript_122250/g.191762 Transcript_122250/m.191762 type:complete len:88 (+) Transcript_122250:265-528(+)
MTVTGCDTVTLTGGDDDRAGIGGGAYFGGEAALVCWMKAHWGADDCLTGGAGDAFKAAVGDRGDENLADTASGDKRPVEGDEDCRTG